MDGNVWYLFNICAPAEHHINRGRTPELDLGLEPGEIGKECIAHHLRGHRKPSTIKSIQDSNLQISGDTMAIMNG
jgi:hypothetical protein